MVHLGLNWSGHVRIAPAIVLTDEQKASVATGNLDRMINFNVEYYLANRARLQQKYDSWRVV